MTTRTLVGLASVWVLGRGRAFGAQQPPTPPAQPTFRASTELIAIDATVVNDRGEPVADLTPEDFVLTIDGTPRRVVSAQFIKQDPPGPPPTLAGRRLPFSTNESAVGGRLVLIVFDLEGIGVGGGRGATVAASRFLDQLASRRPGRRAGVSQRRQHRLHHRSREGEADPDARGRSRVASSPTASTTSACRRPSRSTGRCCRCRRRRSCPDRPRASSSASPSRDPW